MSFLQARFTDVSSVFTAQVKTLFQFAFLERQSVSTQVYFYLVCSISKIHSILFVFVVCIKCATVFLLLIHVYLFDRAIQSCFFFFFFGGCSSAHDKINPLVVCLH